MAKMASMTLNGKGLKKNFEKRNSDYLETWHGILQTRPLIMIMTLDLFYSKAEFGLLCNSMGKL